MEIKKVKKQQQKDKVIKTNWILMPPHSLTNLKYKNIIRMNLDLMVFISIEIICLEKEMGHM